MTCTPLTIAAMLFSLILTAFVCAQSPVVQITASRVSAPDPNKFAVIINGASGEPVYAKQFEQWTSGLQNALTAKYGFPVEHVKVLTESSVQEENRSTAAQVKNAFGSLKSTLQADNVLFVFLIGHGTFDGRESKFNLVGRDLSAVDYSNLFASLPTKRLIIFNMASASGEFIKSLSAKGRIIITATRSGQEQNATRFAGFFITALSATDADMDQDGHISVLEAFAYASRLTTEFYARAGRLATEHALLEDNGDGVGHEKAEAGDGLLARATYLDSLNVEEAAATAAIAKMLRERKRLESDIETLIGNKSSLAEAEYEKQLEQLFIELAKLNRTLKKAGS